VNKDSPEMAIPDHAEELDTEDMDKTISKGVKPIELDREERLASLVVLSGPQTGRIFRIGDQPMLIGRSKGCHIYLPEEGISRHHAQVEREESGDVSLSDLRSTNGTFVNGQQIERQKLNDGDKIQIASTALLKFTYQDSIEEFFYQNQYEQATRDCLTDVHNKRHFQAKLREEFAYSLRHDEPLSLIIFDIDHFKRINDTHGHQAGDLVLSQLARMVHRNLRQEDLIARYGGEEFVIILRNQGEKGAFATAERIRREVEAASFRWQEKRIPVTISLGIATLVQGICHDPSELVQLADEQLYHAKRNGRNRSVDASLGFTKKRTRSGSGGRSGSGSTSSSKGAGDSTSEGGEPLAG